MSDEPGRLKETVAFMYVVHWKQYKDGLLRLAEAKNLVVSLRVTYGELRDGGLTGVAVGRGKRKLEAVEAALEGVVERLTEAEVLRFSLHFQLRALRADMMEAVHMSEDLVQVWHSEVEELYRFCRRGGREPALDGTVSDEEEGMVEEGGGKRTRRRGGGERTRRRWRFCRLQWTSSRLASWSYPLTMKPRWRSSP